MKMASGSREQIAGPRTTFHFHASAALSASGTWRGLARSGGSKSLLWLAALPFVLLACSSSGGSSATGSGGGLGNAGGPGAGMGGFSSTEGANSNGGNPNPGGDGGDRRTGGASGLDAGEGGSAGTGDRRADAGAAGVGVEGNQSDAGADGTGAAGGASRDSGAAVGAANPPPALTGAATPGTVTILRATAMGRLPPSFLGFSFEKSHMSDTFFTPDHAALIAMFKLLGPGVVRIGADDVNISVWQPNAASVRVGTTSPEVGTAQVDALAGFLTATGWRTIYSVNMRGGSSPATAVAEARYVVPKLGSSLVAMEIGNELNFYGAIGTIRPLWHSYSTAIHAALPGTIIAGPGIFEDINYAVPFIQAEASEIGIVTHHYYRATAGTAGATLANLLAPDQNMVSQSQALAAAVNSARIAGGYRWGEMNSYSSHGQPGASDVLGSALWGINFMLTTAQYGSAGVNFHGGGQNMDGNVCPDGAASCDRPFRYSPILEIDSRVSAAAPLFYGMLLVAQAGTGPMVATRTAAGNLNFRAYTITPADGSTRVVLVNSDATNGINAAVDMGAPVAGATAIYLRGTSLTAATGTTLAGAPVTSQGAWNPNPAYTLPVTGNVVNVPVPAASAVLIDAR
jgi:hypothetical protein